MNAKEIFIVSWSFPPDSTPAAHRPYYVAIAFAQSGFTVHLCTRRGFFTGLQAILDAASEEPTAQRVPEKDIPSSKLLKKAYRASSAVMGVAIEIDKAFFWGLRIGMRLWFRLIVSLLRNRSRPIVWATAPAATNINLSAVCGLLSAARLSIDIRDQLRGIGRGRMPLITRLALSRSESISAVSPSLCKLINHSSQRDDVLLAYNGVADHDYSPLAARHSNNRDMITITHVGAIYGGARPVEFIVEALRDAAQFIKDDFSGIDLLLVSRENLSGLNSFSSGNFKVRTSGPVSKATARRMSAQSDINLVLVGNIDMHRNAIPLKAFDLLGTGRPLLYCGPDDADGVKFLIEFRGDLLHILSSTGPANPQKLATRLTYLAMQDTKPVLKPSALQQAISIVDRLSRK